MLLSGIDFEGSVKTGRIKWEGEGFLNHYVLFLMPVFALIIAIINVVNYQYYVWQIWSAVSVFLSFLILVTIRKNDKLIKVPFNSSFIDLRRTIKEEFEPLGWKVLRSNPQYLTAEKKNRGIGSRMAVLNYEGEIYINIINNTSVNGNYIPFSLGRNKKFKKKLVELIINQPISKR
ncbi:hypothetical protein C8P68_11071 [Mucilaginibacter yixingensis]|uniref:Uncharacterized protein n=1 Tax=Mucilaginibacter yixingensis TaxID=1295612 RepID=A0A2T5J5E2_9SPHI|nr:hypothetical protein [Mucilaginibacter yixingensis]PTQ92940.1 hypothetical protein C8P68_11071 [Mucilaginibacter yixingensis]